MNTLFSMLFHAWCAPYNPERLPENLRDNPISAYGMYTFEAGVKLGLELAVSCLDPEDLAREL